MAYRKLYNKRNRMYDYIVVKNIDHVYMIQ